MLAGILVATAIVIGLAYWAMKPRPELPASVTKHFTGLAEVEFCTIHPESNAFLKPPADYGNGEIDQFAIVDVKQISDWSDLFSRLVDADRENPGTAANCFNPRHAIRDPGNSENYLLICFECYQVRYQCNGESGLILITDSPSKLFEFYVDRHKLNRAKSNGKQ